MNVAELIAALQTLPQDALVLVDGFDSTDYDYAATPAIVRVAPVERVSHGPAFCEPTPYNTRGSTVIGEPIEAVYIGMGEL